MERRKMLMKRTFGFTLLLALLLLTACGGGSKYEKTVQQGDELLAAGNYEQAVETYSAALELQESSPEAYQGMGKAYLALEQYEDAAAALDKAIELGAQSAELYAACGDAYFAIGGAVSDDLSRIEAQQTAVQRYKSALELQPEESSYYQKLADFYIGLGEYSQALDILEDGAAKTKDAGFQEQAEQVKHTMEVQQSLNAIPYAGDRIKCVMSAEQAAGYAQLLADGIRGAIPVFDTECELCYANYDASNVAYWDQPFTAHGYNGSEETTRGYALLCDLAGDGRPYLLLMDEDTKQQGCFGDTSISIYGWQDDKAVQLFAYEGWLRADYWIYRISGNSYGLSISGSSGAGDHGGEEYRFLNGSLLESNSWREVWEEDPKSGEAKLHIWDNDKEIAVLTEEEFENWESPKDESSEETAPMSEDLDPLENHLVEACPLKEMVDKLNAYASTVSGGSAPVADYTFRTDKQQAAKAMLELLKKRDEVRYCRLVDMDGDGSKELILNVEESPELVLAIYTFKDGALKKVKDCIGTYRVPFEDTPWGMIVEESTLERNKNNETYAIRISQHMMPGVSMLFTLTDQWAVEYNNYEPEGPDDPPIPARYIHNGQEITKEEYYKISNQYQPVEDGSGDHRQETVDELISWLK